MKELRRSRKIYEPVYRLKVENDPENKKILKKLLEEKFDFIYSKTSGDNRVIKVPPDKIGEALKLINEVKGTPTLF